VKTNEPQQEPHYSQASRGMRDSQARSDAIECLKQHGQTGLQVVTAAALGRTLYGHSHSLALNFNDLIMVVEGGKPVSVLIPYDVWFQIQHFVSTIVSREG
jgi:hypothetical protein